VQVWNDNRDQLVGWFPRLDAVFPGTGRPRYLSKLATLLLRGRYSIVLTKGAIMHAKYLAAYSDAAPPAVRALVAERRNCEDIAMQFVVSNATGTAPLTVYAPCAPAGLTLLRACACGFCSATAALPRCVANATNVVHELAIVWTALPPRSEQICHRAHSPSRKSVRFAVCKTRAQAWCPRYQASPLLVTATS
jgi:hypothetical protein